MSFSFAFKISMSFGVVKSDVGGAGGFTVGENMRLLIVDELLSAVKYPSGHHSWFDTTAGIDTFAFGLCLLTRRSVACCNICCLSLKCAVASCILPPTILGLLTFKP